MEKLENLFFKKQFLTSFPPVVSTKKIPAPAVHASSCLAFDKSDHDRCLPYLVYCNVFETSSSKCQHLIIGYIFLLALLVGVTVRITVLVSP